MEDKRSVARGRGSPSDNPEASPSHYPLKFSSHQGTFAVTLYLITENGLPPYPASRQAVPAIYGSLESYGFSAGSRSLKVAESGTTYLDIDMPKLHALWQKIAGEGRMTLTEGVLNEIEGEDINSPDNSVTRWPQDFMISF